MKNVLMKNVLVVTSHPNLSSFNFAMSAQAIKTFEGFGCSVNITGLYQTKFTPLLSYDDFPTIEKEQCINLLKQQERNLFSQDIMTEQKKLLEADLIVLQFPIWWGSYPAILKGWIERVFTYGFAYGSAFNLENKSVLLSVTTGGAKDRIEETFYQNKLKNMTKEVFGYMKMNILPPYICHGPASISAEQRLDQLEIFNQHVIKIYNENLIESTEAL
jgi:NAD(P)H dehydrogenase (quinone)